MERKKPDAASHHNITEIGNVYSCQKMVNKWVTDKTWPSAMVIKTLHKELMKGIDSYSKKGLLPAVPGEYRKTDLKLEGYPENIYVRAEAILPLMSQYCSALDNALSKLPRSPQTKVGKIIKTAAWAYYTYIRIHPFYDGNGRIGRMIIKRILKGSGLRDLILHDPRWDGSNRSTHLDAMDSVNATGNLSALEHFLLNSLKIIYINDKKSPEILSEINEQLKIKEKELNQLTEQKPLTNIWEGFAGVDLFGNPDDHEQYGKITA